MSGSWRGLSFSGLMRSSILCHIQFSHNMVTWLWRITYHFPFPFFSIHLYSIFPYSSPSHHMLLSPDRRVSAGWHPFITNPWSWPFLKFRSIHNLSITFPKVPNLLYDTPIPFIIPLTHLFIIYICLMIPYNLSWSLRILYDPLQYSMTIQPLHDPYVIHMLSVCYVSHTHLISSHALHFPCFSPPMFSITSHRLHFQCFYMKPCYL